MGGRQGKGGRGQGRVRAIGSAASTEAAGNKPATPEEDKTTS